jgi:chemosensory pili system protein ChpA (sensor histidine kinase/response regulator)
MQPDQLQQIKGYYLEAAEAHLKLIEQHLLHLRSTLHDPDQVNELCHAVRCGIVGGANLLPISQFHTQGIHQTGLCLVDCVQLIRQQGSLKVDQTLQALLMQVFYALKKLIRAMNEPSGLTDEQVTQILSTTESMREQLKDHLKELSRQPSSANLDTASAEETEVLSLDDLQSLIDELLQDS